MCIRDRSWMVRADGVRVYFGGPGAYSRANPSIAATARITVAPNTRPAVPDGRASTGTGTPLMGAAAPIAVRKPPTSSGLKIAVLATVTTTTEFARFVTYQVHLPSF